MCSITLPTFLSYHKFVQFFLQTPVIAHLAGMQKQEYICGPSRRWSQIKQACSEEEMGAALLGEGGMSRQEGYLPEHCWL